MGAATMTATAMTMGVAPTPAANAAVSIDIPPGPDPLVSIELPVGLYTTGLPFRILDLIGQGLTPDDLPIDVDLIEFLSALDPQAFYNAVNATPYGAEITLDNPLYGIPALAPLLAILAQAGLGGLTGEDIDLDLDLGVRAIVIASFGFASYTTMDTYRKLAESTRTGEAPGAGYTPVGQADPSTPVTIPNPLAGIPGAPPLTTSVQLPALPNITALVLLLIRDPGRPNGGIGARFAPVFALFGIDTVTPDVEPVLPDGFDLTQPVVILQPGAPGCAAVLPCVSTTWQGGALLLPIHVNVGWEYDPISDFPATANPFSIVNSLMAGMFPTYILREPDLDGLAGQVADIALGDILGALLPGADEEDVKDALNIYLTLGSGALPMLEPQRLLVDIINLFTGLGLGTPISDSLEPALKILTNIGYTDVVTPQMKLDNPALYGQYDDYERMLDDDSMATPTPFFSETLSLAEYLQVPEDVIEALIDGFTETFGNGYQVFDPARRNALATLLNALGVNLPSLDLGHTLQSVVPSTFDAQSITATSDVAPTAFSAEESADNEGANLRLASDNETEVDDSVNLDDSDGAEGQNGEEGGNDEEGQDTTPSDDASEDGDDSDDGGLRGLFRPRGTVLGGLRDFANNVLGANRGSQTTPADEDEDTTDTDATDPAADTGTDTGDAGDGGAAGAADAA